MKNRIIWIAATALIGFFAVGMLLTIPMYTNADTSINGEQPSITNADMVKTYRQALVQPLNKATSEVKDPEIAKFSQQLVKSYNLDEGGVGVTADNDLSELVPDIAKIQKSALNTTLQEAGKKLTDPELSDFYNRFISNIVTDK